MDSIFTSVRQRQPRLTDKAYLKWIRQLPCVITGQYGVDAAHLRAGSLRYGKPQAGKGEKPNDQWTLPLSRPEHTKQHSKNELVYWSETGINPFELCMELHAHYMADRDDVEGAVSIIQRHNLEAKPYDPESLLETK